LKMPNLSGIEIAKQCKQYRISTKIVLITLHKEKKVFENTLQFNISGYLLKEFALSELESCIKNVMNGESYFSKKIYQRFSNTKTSNSFLEKLTPSEIKILKRIAEEKTSNEIAGLFNISVRTVERHRANIIKKLVLDKKPNSLLIWSQKNKELLL